MKFYNAIKTDPFQIVTKAEIIWMKLFYEVTFKITPQEKNYTIKTIGFLPWRETIYKLSFKYSFLNEFKHLKGKIFMGYSG